MTAFGAGLLLLGLTLSLAAQAHAPEGIASWYGWQEDGKRMANGKRFHAMGMSAASRTLPLGTHVRVTNLANNRHVDLPITDRGPYVGGRLIDVSLGAANRLHMVSDGLARVRVEPRKIPAASTSKRRKFNKGNAGHPTA